MYLSFLKSLRESFWKQKEGKTEWTHKQSQWHLLALVQNDLSGRVFQNHSGLFPAMKQPTLVKICKVEKVKFSYSLFFLSVKEEMKSIKSNIVTWLLRVFPRFAWSLLSSVFLERALDSIWLVYKTRVKYPTNQMQHETYCNLVLSCAWCGFQFVLIHCVV